MFRVLMEQTLDVIDALKCKGSLKQLFFSMFENNFSSKIRNLKQKYIVVV